MEMGAPRVDRPNRLKSNEDMLAKYVKDAKSTRNAPSTAACTVFLP
jgi:hypothetical protein